MRWPDLPTPARMRRVALVAPEDVLRDVLVRVAAAGAVEIDTGASAGDEAGPGEAAGRLARSGQPAPAPALAVQRPDLNLLEQAGRYDLLTGEVQLEAYAAAAVRRAGAAALAGWIPAARVGEVAAALAPAGGAVVTLPRPPEADVPTLLPGHGARAALKPLVQTYGTVPYADLDPAWPAWASYVLMFGIMFGDAGHGLLMIGLAAALRAGWPRWLRRFRAAWPFVAGAGAAATVFGLLYGECFGPTGLVPVIWISPLSHPVTLLLAAAGAGVVLLAGAYTLGAVNRWREGGWRSVLYAPTGIAGGCVFLGAALAAAGWYTHRGLLLAAGGVAGLAGLALAFAGLVAAAGGGVTGLMQAAVELADLVVRLGANVVSFTRLAAFGLTHAALSLLVWEGAAALWRRGGVLSAAAIAAFVLGTALALSLEALVAGIQALRLEYYELFSRVFVTQGRPFRPWHIPTVSADLEPDPPRVRAPA
ncbi:MAG TPA: V-type ATPase 116kDa subunit family protein [Streptosporangiaceae bacterium]